MHKSFDDRVIAAVNDIGPDALPSAIHMRMVGSDVGFLRSLFDPSLARMMQRLRTLSERGVLVERTTVDEQGRDRRTYSVAETSAGGLAVQAESDPWRRSAGA